MISLKRSIAIVSCAGALASCGGTGPAPSSDPHPDPLAPPPTVSDAAPSDAAVAVPPMVPDPVPVVPDLLVDGSRQLDAARARKLVADGRALADDPANLGAAVQLFLAAAALDSLNPHAYWELGWAYQRLFSWNDAVGAWSRLRALDPMYPGLSRHAPILQMRRDRAAAVETLADGDPLIPEEEPRAGTPIRIAAVGDIQLGRSWPEDNPILPPDNAAQMFNRVHDWLRAADVTFGNLETVLADSGESTKCRRGARNCYAFRAPTAYARTLRNVGFDLLSVNNNHTGDFGSYGRQATVEALEGAGLIHSGPTGGVASWETNGLRVALIAFSTGAGPYRIQDLASARARVVDAERNHDLVIVSFHGGAEGAGATHIPRSTELAYGEDRGDVYAFSRAMVDAGADLVLGHGPHVLRGMEIYRGRLIAYSLGNFAAWHGFNLRGSLGLSVVLNVTMAINGVVTAAEIHPVFLEEPGTPTPDPAGRGIEIVRRLSAADLGDALFDQHGRYRRSRKDGTTEGRKDDGNA